MTILAHGEAGTVLVTGASGYLGREVCRQLLAGGRTVVGTYRTAPADLPGVDWRRLDLTDRAAVRELVTSVAPAGVINAAYRYGDWPVTADGAAHVALATAATGTRLVHVSTDVVFAGRPEPYTETDPPDPITPYGAAKAAAETAARAVDPGAALVRTSIIVGDDDSSHHRLALDLATGARSGVLFTDEVRCPVAVTDLAAVLVELLDHDHAGILHAAGADPVSFHEFGLLVTARHGIDPAAVPAGTHADLGVHRPGRIHLDSSLAATLLKTRLRGVREVLGSS